LPWRRLPLATPCLGDAWPWRRLALATLPLGISTPRRRLALTFDLPVVDLDLDLVSARIRDGTKPFSKVPEKEMIERSK